VTGALSPGVKRKKREADHSHPSSAEVKNDGVLPPLLPNVFIATYILTLKLLPQFYVHVLLQNTYPNVDTFLPDYTASHPRGH
jgi:hypothetical protein